MQHKNIQINLLAPSLAQLPLTDVINQNNIYNGQVSINQVPTCFTVESSEAVLAEARVGGAWSDDVLTRATVHTRMIGT